MTKIILTDIDGVCLDWSKQFNKYLEFYHPGKSVNDPTEYSDYAHIEKEMQAHNHSAWFGYMEPLRDAAETLNRLSAEGWEVHGCTAMGHDPYAISLRKRNLEMFFPNVFNRLDTVGFGQGKEEWLEKYRGQECIWIEDKWTNALVGASMGIKTFLMRHSYNASYDDKRIVKVDNWQQIYYYIN